MGRQVRAVTAHSSKAIAFSFAQNIGAVVWCNT
jgi:hypothetical protein